MSATATLTNSASPSACTLEAMTAMAMTSAGDMAAMVPRNPPARAMVRQAAKLPNSTRPTPWEANGARAPENMKVAKAMWDTSSPNPDVAPAEKAAMAFREAISAQSSLGRRTIGELKSLAHADYALA